MKMWKLLIFICVITLSTVGCNNNISLIDAKTEINNVNDTEPYAYEYSIENLLNMSKQSESTERSDELMYFAKDNEFPSENDSITDYGRKTVLESSVSVNCFTNQTLELNLYCEYNNDSPVYAYITSNYSREIMGVDIQDRSYSKKDTSIDIIDYRTIRVLGSMYYEIFDISDFIDESIADEEVILKSKPLFPALTDIDEIIVEWDTKQITVQISDNDDKLKIKNSLKNHSDGWELNRSVPNCPVDNIRLIIKETNGNTSRVSLTEDGCKTAKVNNVYYDLYEIEAIEDILIKYGVIGEMWKRRSG